MPQEASTLLRDDDALLQPASPWRVALYLLYGVLGAFAVGAAVIWSVPGVIQLDEAAPQSSSSTSTLTTTTTTWTLTREITFVTAETRGDPILMKVGDFSKRFNTKVINLGEGKKWDGYKSKVKIVQEYLQDRLLQGDGEKLTAFVDGSDVIWGGCDPGYFQHAYEEIVRLSGARVVFSAELACGEQDCNKVPPVPAWAERLAGGKDLEGGFWKAYVDGCKATWTKECSEKRDCGGLVACANPPAVKFLNSGFVIGPVADLAKMFDWSLENYDEYSVWGDQSVLAEYWLAHPEEVTLDYTGALAASISDMRWELLEPPLQCAMNRWLYLISHRGKQLQDSNGKVMFSSNKTQAERWMLSDAGDGKYWVTSVHGRQLVDSDRFVSLSIFKTEKEMWKFSVGGGGVVYMTSPKDEQLQDDNGHPVFSPNKQGWESWRIHTMEDVPACTEGKPIGGVIMNQAFNRKQCLIHGNGRGFWFFRHVVMSLTDKTVDQVRQWGKHKSLHTR